MARNADRPAREGAEGRGFGAAAAVACAALVALLLAAPILYLRIGEARQRLDGILRRAQGVRQAEIRRVARVRETIERRVDEAARVHDELLAFLENGVQRMLPRPIVEVRLPESSPLPDPVRPSVQPHEAAPEPRAGVYEAGQNAAHDAHPAQPDPSGRETVDKWVASMTRALGLTAVQQERSREVCERYLAGVRTVLDEERKNPTSLGVSRLRSLQQEAITEIRSFLTSEQRVTYERLEHDTEMFRRAGVVIPPLPGAQGRR